MRKIVSDFIKMVMAAQWGDNVPAGKVTSDGHGSDGVPLENLVIDKHGVVYGKLRGKLVLVRCTNKFIMDYSVLSGTVAILGGAFEGMVYLKRVTLPDSVEEIGDNAFCRCTHLRGIQMSICLKRMGNDAFYGCRSLKRIELPLSLTTIKGNPFRCCNIDIKSRSPYFVVDGKLLIGGSKVICQVKQPTSIKVPEYVTEIGENACEMNYRLEKLVLPEGLLVIGKRAFMECHALRYMNMPDSVTTIGDGAFAGCNFWRFTFPRSLSYIGKDALWGFALLSVVIPGNLHIVGADTLPKETIYYIDDIIISCTEDKSKNNGIRRRFRNLLGEKMYEKVKIVNAPVAQNKK